MTGFIKKLFSRDPNRPREAFYLDSDSAKTFGDIEYMRSSKQVRHTFPKGKVDGEYVAEISATKMRKNAAAQPAQPKAQSTFDSSTNGTSSFGSSSFGNPSFSSPSSNSSRKPDSGMDMFRDMAKDLKKKR